MNAFPQQIVYVGEKTDGSYVSIGRGMELRDYFAAKAMNEMNWQNYEISAKRCYEIANAMMKAREEK